MATVVTNAGALEAALMPGLEQTSERLARMGQRGAQSRARVDTGQMRNSITVTPTGKAGRRVEAGAPHSGFNEFGTWKMSAQPFMRPSMGDIHT